MTADLKTHLVNAELTVAPGIFELISATLADQHAFPALYMSGNGTVASALGLPDVGLATFTEMLNRIEAITSRISTPLIADGDTGYGGLLNVDRTVPRIRWIPGLSPWSINCRANKWAYAPT